MAGRIRANVFGLGDSSTNSQNFHWRTNVNGTMGLYRGTWDAPIGSAILLVDANDAVAGTRKYSPGEIIQVVSRRDAGGNTNSGTTTNVSAGVTTITPRSTSSKLIVRCSFNGTTPLVSAVNTTTFWRFLEAGAIISGSPEVGLEVHNASGGLRISAPLTLVDELPNTSLAPRSFSLGAKTSHTSAPATAQSCFWEIYEVQT